MSEVSDSSEYRKRGPAKSDEEREERRLAADRRYRAKNAEKIREKQREWKAKNPDKVKAERERFRERHADRIREEKREQARAKSARERKARDDAERRRVKARERYAADPQAHLEYQRQRRAAQRAADPEGYREAKKQRNKRWADSHKEEQAVKRRQKHRENPEKKREAAARYYVENAEKVRERRRAYYQANREKQLETQAQWRAREKRRRDAGLPVRRLHRVDKEQRPLNIEAADAFFRRVRTADEIAALRVEPRPSAAAIARWRRDCDRARTAFAIAHDPDPVRPVLTTEERARQAAARARREADAVEAARMDAIARLINDRLRQAPRRLPDAPGPWHPSPTTPGGLSL
ncbi:hypothetical protein ACWKWN_20345 [Microbacterium trichothecenolyticum]